MTMTSKLSLRLDRMAKQLFDATGDQLWKSSRVFVTLLARLICRRMTTPSGRRIAQGLELMFQVDGAARPLDQSLIRIDHLQEPAAAFAFYQELNDFLHNQGIETAQANIVSNKNEPLLVARPVSYQVTLVDTGVTASGTAQPLAGGRLCDGTGFCAADGGAAAPAGVGRWRSSRHGLTWPPSSPGAVELFASPPC